jgi:carbon-monoxide dehydrogenase small subunit
MPAEVSDMTKHIVQMAINGERYEFLVEPQRTLLDVIRNDAGLTGTKRGCDVGDCGACTVLMNGKAVNSCLVLAVEANGAAITTVEGLSGMVAEGGSLHPLQQSFLQHGAVQCGFCTPGMLMMAKALLDENPHPTEEQVRAAIAGNLCRCTGYVKIVEAILDVVPAGGS